MSQKKKKKRGALGPRKSKQPKKSGKKKSNLKNVHIGIFVNQEKIHLHPVFFSILERKYFGGFRKKTHRLYHLFSFFST